MKIKVPITLEFDAVKMEDPSLVLPGDRIFLERGYYKDARRAREWIRTGEFMELDNPGFLEREKERLQDKTWREHHNFVLVKQTINKNKDESSDSTN